MGFLFNFLFKKLNKKSFIQDYLNIRKFLKNIRQSQSELKKIRCS